MVLFWYEIAHFLTAIFGILVSISAAALFFLVIRYERQLQTLWRAIGFSALAIAMLLFILERKFAFLGIPALLAQAFAFISIYIGVFAEPKLSQLLEIGKKPVLNEHGEYKNFKNNVGKKSASPLSTFIITLIALLLVTVFWTQYVPAFLEAITVLFIALTIPIQFRRFQKEKHDLRARRLNLYPLLGYIGLLIGACLLLLFRLPPLDIVIIREFTLDYSLVWRFGLVFLFIGFFFLANWAWTFVRVRPFLRTYVVFLTIAIIVASLGSLVFTTLIFRIVERNNLQLMTNGVKTEDLVLQDRANTALLVARTIGNDQAVLQAFGQHQQDTLREKITQYLNNSNADAIRVYDENSVITLNPSDERDEGRAISGDRYLNFVLTERKQLKTFDIRPGVLASEVLGRALYPIMNNQQVVTGVIEVDYTFDTAFVDFSKEKTGLDVTIYANKKRSASTILTLDNVSRWTGLEETDQAVVSTVIGKGQLLSIALGSLGRPYYSAFAPIRNVNGDIVGMVSVGTPTATLFEETRQQLITTFLIVMLISLLVALVGYLAIRSFGKK